MHCFTWGFSIHFSGALAAFFIARPLSSNEPPLRHRGSEDACIPDALPSPTNAEGFQTARSDRGEPYYLPLTSAAFFRAKELRYLAG